ncbi:MAG TPA: hypothetical protein VNZ86_10115 [Bacteroidia bacterium]|jgi:hypothetical protein|nr:hypothetical protein [Bacteroidia bacterium]
MNRVVRPWTKLALLNFLIASLFGVLLRLDAVKEIPGFNYIHIETAHWHLALLGWVYLALFSFMLGAFLPDPVLESGKYRTLIRVTQFLLLANVLANIWFGYTLITIGLDVVLLLFMGYSIVAFLTDLRKVPCTFPVRLVRIALFFLVFSFLGILAKLPLDMLFPTKRSILYYLSTQFFLHFNYNGWFTFGIFALLFRLAEQEGIVLEIYRLQWFIRIMAAMALVTFCLSIHWGYPGHPVFLFIAAGAAFVQLAMVFYIRKDLMNLFSALRPRFKPLTLYLLEIALVAYIIKLTLQAVVVIPFVATLALTIRNYMIAYLHLMFLGVTTLFLLAYGIQQDCIRVKGPWGKAGVVAFGAGFVAMEVVLVVQGTLLWMGQGFMPFYYELIFAVSLFLPVGLTIMLWQTFVSRNQDRTVIS